MAFKKFTKQPKAADKYKDKGLYVTVQQGKPFIKNGVPIEPPYGLINLYNLDFATANEIKTRLMDPQNKKYTQNAYFEKDNFSHLIIKVRTADIDNWLDKGDLNAVKSILLKSGKYDTGAIMEIEDEIATSFSSSNKETIEKAHEEAVENSVEMWQKYLSKISDPVFRSQLELYTRIYGNSVYGHQLSIQNANLIRSVDKDATFVVAKSVWRNQFNRGVKRGAKPLPYYAPYAYAATPTQKEIDDMRISLGWEDTPYQDLPVQVRTEIEYRLAQNKISGQRKVVGYDVRDTYLLSGAKEDVFNTQEGYLNNLKLELNYMAQKRENEKNSGTTHIEGEELMNSRTEKACEYMKGICEKKKIDTTTPFTDSSNKLADYLVSYCTANATKSANILNSGNIQAYAENATQVILILTNLGLNALKRFNIKYEYTKKEAAALMGIVWKIVGPLERASNSTLTEGVLSWIKDKAMFIKKFIKALYQIGCSIKKDGNKPLQQTEPSVESSKEAENATNDVEAMKTVMAEAWNKINKNFF